MPGATLTFPTLEKAPASLCIDCTLRLGGSWKHLLQAGPEFSCHSATQAPSPTFLGHPCRRCPYPCPDLQQVPLATPRSLGCDPRAGRGLGGGPKSVPMCGGGPIEAAGERCVHPRCVAGKLTPEPHAYPHPEERLGSRMVAPSAGQARKCLPAGVGSERWAQMVLFALLPGQGLVHSGRRARECCGHRSGTGPARGRSLFSRRPLEGCGPRPRGALSMVRRAAEYGPALLASLLPGSCSPQRPLLGLPGPLDPFPFLGFLLLFFLLLLVFLSPFPHSLVLRPPPRLS